MIDVVVCVLCNPHHMCTTQISREFACDVSSSAAAQYMVAGAAPKKHYATQFKTTLRCCVCDDVWCGFGRRETNIMWEDEDGGIYMMVMVTRLDDHTKRYDDGWTLICQEDHIRATTGMVRMIFATLIGACDGAGSVLAYISFKCLPVYRRECVSRSYSHKCKLELNIQRIYIYINIYECLSDGTIWNIFSASDVLDASIC